MRLKIKDFVAIILCLGIFTINIYYFVGSLSASLKDINTEPIATITFKYRTAQRRLQNRTDWDRLQNESPVYNNDIIRTADLSEATVFFIDGSGLELHENTLVQISYDIEQKGSIVAFEFGALDYSTDEKAYSSGTLFKGTTKLQLTKETSVKLNAKPREQFAEITLQTGEAFVSVEYPETKEAKTFARKTQLLKTGDSVRVVDFTKQKLAIETKETDKSLLKNSVLKKPVLMAILNQMPENDQLLSEIAEEQSITVVIPDEQQLESMNTSEVANKMGTYDNEEAEILMIEPLQKIEKKILPTEKNIVESSRDLEKPEIVAINIRNDEVKAIEAAALAKQNEEIKAAEQVAIAKKKKEIEEAYRAKVAKQKAEKKAKEKLATKKKTGTKTLVAKKENSKNSQKQLEIKKVEGKSTKSKIPFNTIKTHLSFPENNFKFNEVYFEQQGNIIFKWAGIDGANNYTFTLLKKNGDETFVQLLNKTVNKPEFVLEGDDFDNCIDKGDYAWVVKATNVEKQNSIPETFEFNVSLQELPEIEVDTSKFINER